MRAPTVTRCNCAHMFSGANRSGHAPASYSADATSATAALSSTAHGLFRSTPTTATPRTLPGALQKDAALYALALREDGLLPGTLVATGAGWRRVETLRPGDMVLTFDNGMQPVARLHQLSVPRVSLPVHKRYTMVVPPGVLGNRDSLQLLPLQEIIIESDFAEMRYGDPFVLVQALMLDGFDGIHRAPIEGDLQICLPTFDREQLIHSCGTALVTARAESDFSPLGAAAAEGPDYLRVPADDLPALLRSLQRDSAGTMPARALDDPYAASAVAATG